MNVLILQKGFKNLHKFVSDLFEIEDCVTLSQILRIIKRYTFFILLFTRFLAFLSNFIHDLYLTFGVISLSLKCCLYNDIFHLSVHNIIFFKEKYILKES